ncbi:MAG: hypothetical protein F6K48_16860 [Okeania sp. SIO3H1]|uniref:hypothetical protein n=1 Tax=Okeania sp. SIO1I7 TaxID=2607772 RepID=UPI0013CA7D09|nr:hypothetical protein [Okeania sp. SIO1I7]NEN90481.1 hypothetical protein [Okeania sp. SIO3H1]NET27650.1 hypothetical protein [Okeania sp. SIO1I7]
MPIIGLEENKNSYRSNRIVRQICLAQFDKQIRSIAFPWLRRELPLYKGMKKRWQGLLAISNQPRKNKVQYFKFLNLTRGTDN